MPLRITPRFLRSTQLRNLRSNIIKMTLSGSHNSSPSGGPYTLSSLPKSSVFTDDLPPDQDFPTPKDSHSAARETLGPRLVRGALYTFVRPEPTTDPELLAVSRAAMQDLGLASGIEHDKEFIDVLSGNRIITWDEKEEKGIYPWAQCYGGYQFGQWAGQLGDGRAISLFETTNLATGARYEIQLKGAGKTPYSRFADGKAVLRSSIREFIVSEYLNALKIPSTRALSLILAPHSRVQRERVEPGAIVARFAQTWLRIGTFDLLRSRGDRKLLRQLATFTATQVFGGWEKLPGQLVSKDSSESPDDHPRTGIPGETVEGDGKDAENRFTRLYRHIVRLNARTVAAWQAYGFMNGVLNTDNTSILGLSMDFGPFAFMDNFDPSYTPNHDDFMLRYSYRNQPTIIWWNLVRLGEAFGELIGSGGFCDDTDFIQEGVKKDSTDELVERAENLIEKAGEEYKAVFMSEYKRLMTLRLGLRTVKEKDFNELYSELLDSMEALELDFNASFRLLSNARLSDLETDEQRKEMARQFFHPDQANISEDGLERLAAWLSKWAERVKEDWSVDHDQDRQAQMRAANPNFVPRSWVLDEIIDRVEKKGDRDILHGVMDMTLNPFNDRWSWDEETEKRFCGPVPKYKRLLQCSCSS